MTATTFKGCKEPDENLRPSVSSGIGESKEVHSDPEVQKNEATDAAAKRTSNGILLVPQPTDDPEEPLVRLA